VFAVVTSASRIFTGELKQTFPSLCNLSQHKKHITATVSQATYFNNEIFLTAFPGTLCPPLPKANEVTHTSSNETERQGKNVASQQYTVQSSG
jgi:hypothetical protein